MNIKLIIEGIEVSHTIVFFLSVGAIFFLLFKAKSFSWKSKERSDNEIKIDT